jgi:hypothetical protein
LYSTIGAQGAVLQKSMTALPQILLSFQYVNIGSLQFEAVFNHNHQFRIATQLGSRYTRIHG